MTVSFRDTARLMDPQRPAQGLRALNDEFFVPPGEVTPRAFRTLSERSNDATPVAFLFYNAFLMTAIQVRADRGSLFGALFSPTINIGAKPALKPRQDEIGRQLFSERRTQTGAWIAALCEVWQDTAQEAIVKPWPDGGIDVARMIHRDLVPLPDLKDGLMGLVQNARIVRTAQHIFDSRGQIFPPWSIDLDYFSRKGVLMFEVDVGRAANLEIYCTHLFNGGKDGKPDNVRIVRQMEQINEMIEFIRRERKVENPTIIAGDFNIPDDTPGYRQMRDRLYETLRVVDTWRVRADGAGLTSSLDRNPGICTPGTPTPENPTADRFCVDAGLDPAAFPPSRRLDYVFVQEPQLQHRIAVEVTRPQRRNFPRPAGAPDLGAIASMSDHVGIELNLLVRDTG